MEIIGQQIKKYRIKNGYTQEKLGNLVGVTTQAVSKWERGSAPDASILPGIADALGVGIDTLYGRENHDIQAFVTKKLSVLPQDTAFRSAFEICWSLFLGLIGDPEFTDDFSDVFMGQSDLGKDKSQDYFAKMVRDNGLALARMSNSFSQFYLLIQPENESILNNFEDIESVRKIFAVFAEKNILKTIFYLYSMPAIPITAELIGKATGFDMCEVERCMNIICENNLAVHIKIATVEGQIDSYTIRKESCAIPLLCFADEIAKGSPFPFFNMFDREKPLL